MPQADFTTFHSLIIAVLVLLLVFFNFTYNYITPNWSTFIKLNVKKLLPFLFLVKNIKIISKLKNVTHNTKFKTNNQINL
jgi:hypothetical protein